MTDTDLSHIADMPALRAAIDDLDRKLARMLAIADIFEALTAVDRPYKQGKRLSEAVAIMASMRDAGHIDPALFALFLESGVYQDYARRFMQPACIDEVDVAALLQPAA